MYYQHKNNVRIYIYITTYNNTYTRLMNILRRIKPALPASSTKVTSSITPQPEQRTVELEAMVVRLSSTKEPEPLYQINFDGCSKGNPGLAGAGAVLYRDGTEIDTRIQALGKKTNNQAEYAGLILGLQMAVDHNIRRLEVQGDSQLIIKQMRGEYKVSSAELKPLYNIARELSITFEQIRFTHIYRKYNSRADELSNEALQEDNTL